ncbi:hypothetical protein AURDEDRAFT_128427 [Auricularia subglabra TFB-10046 SS5]|nr:hypothetical protein AURDEDRAFT_128427 [Auricularia subglabra TFB-10046 SS5]
MARAATLLGIVALISCAICDLPASGGPYFIQNPQSGLVVDDNGNLSNAGNPIIGYTVNPTASSNQQWNIRQIDATGSSGIFEFTCAGPQIKVYVNGLPGNEFTAQGFASPLNVTEHLPGVYS